MSSSSDLKENIVPNMRLFGQEKGTQQDARQPLATISSNNQQNSNTVKSRNLVATTTKTLVGPEQHSKSIILILNIFFTCMSVIESLLRE